MSDPASRRPIRRPVAAGAALAALAASAAVPLLIAKGQRVQGFSAGAYDTLFGAAR